VTTTLTTVPARRTPIRSGWLRRLCARLGGWCDLLLDTHHARVPF
jgi:hypothetical protein